MSRTPLPDDMKALYADIKNKLAAQAQAMSMTGQPRYHRAQAQLLTQPVNQTQPVVSAAPVEPQPQTTGVTNNQSVSNQANQQPTKKECAMQIFPAIINIINDLAAVGKSRVNPQQHYQYRGIDDLMNAIHPLLGRHGVFAVPEVLSCDQSAREGRNSTLIHTKITVKYTFYAADGSSITAVTAGEAFDASDKSLNKAMSAAFKYALIQVFCIPTEDLRDSEEDDFQLKTTNSNTSSHLSQSAKPVLTQNSQGKQSQNVPGVSRSAIPTSSTSSRPQPRPSAPVKTEPQPQPKSRSASANGASNITSRDSVNKLQARLTKCQDFLSVLRLVASEDVQAEFEEAYRYVLDQVAEQGESALPELDTFGKGLRRAVEDEAQRFVNAYSNVYSEMIGHDFEGTGSVITDAVDMFAELADADANCTLDLPLIDAKPVQLAARRLTMR